MKDFTITTNGLFASILPNNAAAAEQWKKLHQDGNHVILTAHLSALKAALKASGWTYETRKTVARPKLTKSDLATYEELMA